MAVHKMNCRTNLNSLGFREIILLIMLLSSLQVRAQNLLEVEGKVSVTSMDTITSNQDSTAANVVRLSDGTLAVRQYEIGDMAQGGIVFWVDETGEHGLVSDISDLVIGLDSLHEWSSISVQTGATGGTTEGNIGSVEGKGAGSMNTMLIVASDPGDLDSAARLCTDLVKGDYGDWYLPSMGELNLMYLNLYVMGLGGFAETDNYWSSTEETFQSAWFHYFKFNVQSSELKSDVNRVRAIRSF